MNFFEKALAKIFPAGKEKKFPIARGYSKFIQGEGKKARILFGKYAGKNIAEVNTKYLKWLRKQHKERNVFDSILIDEINRELKRRHPMEAEAKFASDQYFEGFRDIEEHWSHEDGFDPRDDFGM